MKFNILLFTALLFVSCNNQANEVKNEEQKKSEQPNELKIGNKIITKNPLIGTYMGELPCADCKAIKTVLTLGGANFANYTERKITIGKGSAKIINGIWSVNADSTLITIVGRETNGEKLFFKREGKSLIPMKSETERADCGEINCALVKTEAKPINAADAIKKAKEQSAEKKGVNGSFEKVESLKK
ncbi:MAG: copper resistance protein NlpE N-terminal domain-containing protein [Flavobacteriales bacterium]|jgi:hypothetical protein